MKAKVFAVYPSQSLKLSSGVIDDRGIHKTSKGPKGSASSAQHQPTLSPIEKKASSKDPENEFGAHLIGTFTLRKALREVQQP